MIYDQLAELKILLVIVSFIMVQAVALRGFVGEAAATNHPRLRLETAAHADPQGDD